MVVVEDDHLTAGPHGARHGSERGLGVGDPLQDTRSVDQVELRLPAALADVALVEDEVRDLAGRARLLGGGDHLGVEVHPHHAARVHTPGYPHGERAGTAADVEHRHARLEDLEKTAVAVLEGPRSQDVQGLARDVGVIGRAHQSSLATRVSRSSTWTMAPGPMIVVDSRSSMMAGPSMHMPWRRA